MPGTFSWRHALAALAALGLGACASMTSEYDPPKVSIENFRSLPGEASGPRFEVDLRIQNPNEQALDISGIAYDIALQDVDLISGVSNEVPRVAGYSEEVVTLESGLNTIQLVRFLTGLGTGSRTLDHLEYEVRVKIDFHGFTPTQRIVETGVIGQPRAAD